jgi:hypothetical protein
MPREDTFVVERTRHVAAPPDAIRPRLIDLHRWRDWSPWEGLDPDLERRYGGADEGVGAWYAWKGNRKAGAGRMEIVAVDDTSVAIDVTFLRPFRSQSRSTLELRADADGTEVVWRMTGPLNRMMQLFGRLMSMDRILGPDLEQGLENLDAEVVGPGA